MTNRATFDNLNVEVFYAKLREKRYPTDKLETV